MMDAMLDANGVAITVGATVKLVGVVTSLNPFDNRFHDVTISLSHPLPASTGGAKDMPPYKMNYSEGAERDPPGNSATIAVPPGLLIVGA